jgi:XTP/dITP diphosphohydrolase
VRAFLATSNRHKTQEVAAILGPGVELVAMEPGVEETGETFEDNALLKGRAVAARTGELSLADDSGIVVDALDGAPGVRSARWTDDGDWIPRLLRELRARGATTARARSARFVCAAVAVWPDGRWVVARGVVEGHVAEAERGEDGFGYDPVFVPAEGDGRTFAEMAPAEKEALSHRGRAFRLLAPRLTSP